MDANVILACRSEERAAAAMAYIRKQVPGATLEFAHYDQVSFSSLDAFVTRFQHLRLDAFVFNAGIFGSDATLKTENGFPLIFGTNFTGAFYLTEQCKEKFLREHTRLVYVSSLAGRMANEELLLTFEGGGANRRYGYSKLCVAQYACVLMEEGLEAVLVHPGVGGTSIFIWQRHRNAQVGRHSRQRTFSPFPKQRGKAVSGQRPCSLRTLSQGSLSSSPFSLWPGGIARTLVHAEKFQRTKVGSDAWTMIQATASKLK
ncbi:MAG: SDR family NAD(P)-dependent oxidoreductase [Oscillospiraceae bacterium]|nr:SDR family NAD(P)-dependent oxidoreductase [Oscillospiraceae bacterium]